MQKKGAIGLGVALGVVLALAMAVFGFRRESTGSDKPVVETGEARAGSLTVDLAGPVPGVRVREAKVPGRPIVVIDAGHGGKDPGASGVSGSTKEKDLTLALARELADLLEERGRVRVALTREDDRYLTLEQRPAIARQLNAALFLSIHMDSAANPDARGATVYSLSDVASSAEAARFANAENSSDLGLGGESDDQVRALLADVALRGQMEASAKLAERLIRRADGRLELRPRPHQFAAFHVLRRADTPGVLFEAGYISNAEDEARLMTKQGRAPIVLALAQAIEADVATRTVS